MKKQEIIFSSYFSFIFWFLPYQAIKKIVELEKLPQKLKIKSDVYEGIGIKISSFLFFIWRYLFIFLLIVAFIPFGISNIVVFVLSFCLGISIASLFFFNKKIVYSFLFIETLIFLMLFFFQINVNFIFIFLYGLSFFIVFYLIFLSIKDYFKIFKKHEFYKLTDIKIIIGSMK